MTSDQILSQRYQWHGQVHLEWGKERLFFCRLGFSPIYRRKKVIDGILLAFRDHRISSYAIYEVTGVYDLMLRVWLPTAFHTDDLERSIEKHLGRNSPKSFDAFHVTDTLLHWVWESNGDGMREPSEEALLGRLSDDEIVTINCRELSDGALLQYERANLIAPARHEKGVKFIVVVTVYGQLDIDGRQAFRDKLCAIVEGADAVQEKSVYEGVGFGTYLILGRVAYDDFHAISGDLTEAINFKAMPEAFMARTYTYVMATEDFLDFREDLPLSGTSLEPESRPVSGLLERRYESTVFEVKGSAFVNLRQYFAKGVDRADERMTDAVAKTVTAFLNTDGGQLVIGALETSRFSAEEVGPSKPPVLEDHWIIGLNPDYEVAGDWERFERRLRGALESRIRPRPSLWYTLVRDSAGKRELCVVTVREPDRWFYAYPKAGEDKGPIFYVRDGNESKPLEGPDADDWRKRGRIL